MNTPPTRRAWPAFVLAALLPTAALAQGKIDDVERTARSGGDHGGGGGGGGGGDDCNFLCSLLGGLFHHHHDAPPAPRDTTPQPPPLPKQTYGRYPWGGPRRDQQFVTPGPQYRPRFGVTGVSWFKDAASTLSGISVDVEGGFQDTYLALNVTGYREPTPTDLDRLTTVRAEGGTVTPAGRGFVTLGLGGRLVCLDTDRCGYGGDVALGARVLPARPLVMAAHAAIGGMTWGGDNVFLVTEYQATASVALGRLEAGGGWHWLKLGSANAFGGPVLTARVWF